MRKVGIFALSVMLAAALLPIPAGSAGVLDWEAPAVNLQAVVTEDNQIKVTWDFPISPYWVDISAVRSAMQVEADLRTRPIYPGNDVFFTLPEQDTYLIIMYYQLTSSSAWSHKATTLVHYETPFSPISLEVTQVNALGLVTLRWDDVMSYETGWFVRVTGADRQLNPVDETIPVRPNDDHSAEVTIAGPLKPEGQYNFTVWAVNGGLAGPSANVSAAIKMKAPTNLTAQAKRNGELYVELRWTKNSDLADCYEIERTDPGGGKTCFTTATDDTSWPDMSVEPLSTYRYRVRAVCADRPDYNSDFSEEAVVATTEFAFVTVEPSATLRLRTGILPRVTFKPSMGIKPGVTLKPGVRIDLTP
ncbi:MAG: fibronectin type III domain-containing protein [Clostridiales bacterium]|nr:fibronectin type III domain-containing protein [Clostridiales bacterium]